MAKTLFSMTAVLALLAAAGMSVYALRAQGPSSKAIRLPPDNALATLKPGPGLEVVESNCAICHSTDYIVRQPGGDASHWEPEVRKMMTAYGAHLTDADAKTIVSYLATEYGAAPPSPEGAPGGRPRASHPSPAAKHPSKVADRSPAA
ncbi:MAG TPA: cytochrome c [Terriglobia bacterium]|jgi:mono/diheme cytochrome c family protein|nr:cytochrome c [Terriglobia bacterium]